MVERQKARVNLEQMNPEQRSQLHGAETTISPSTHILAIASGKGGVGKSTVTVNLAAALEALGYHIGILDCDVYGFSIPRMVGADEMQPRVVEGKIMPVVTHGMKIISMGNFVRDNAPVIWRGPMLGKVLDQFLTDVNWGELDFLLLDLPPGTGDVALDVARLLPTSSLIIVTTPQQVAAGVASRAGQMARRTDQRILGVVENMSAFICPDCGKKTTIFGEGGGSQLAQELGVPLLGQVPLTMEARVLGDQGIPAASVAGSLMQETYQALAKRVIDEVGVEPAKSR